MKKMTKLQNFVLETGETELNSIITGYYVTLNCQETLLLCPPEHF
jgi:hypothetical protein